MGEVHKVVRELRRNRWCRWIDSSGFEGAIAIGLRRSRPYLTGGEEMPKLALARSSINAGWGWGAGVLAYELACRADWAKVAPPCHNR